MKLLIVTIILCTVSFFALFGLVTWFPAANYVIHVFNGFPVTLPMVMAVAMTLGGLKAVALA